MIYIFTFAYLVAINYRSHGKMASKVPGVIICDPVWKYFYREKVVRIPPIYFIYNEEVIIGRLFRHRG